MLKKLLTYWRIALITFAVFSVSVTSAYWIGQHIGKANERARIAEKINEQNIESERASDEVTKEVQKLTDVELDRELCSLGIVRNNDGCE